MENGKWKIIKFLVGVLFFAGCSVKEKPIYAVIKTPQVKIADQGFLKEGFGYKELVIYKAGMEPFRLVVKNSVVCFNDRCMDKEVFVKKFLGNYPSDIFDKILNKEPIKLKKGWIYRVDKKRVFFKSPNLLIMIKDL